MNRSTKIITAMVTVVSVAFSFVVIGVCAAPSARHDVRINGRVADLPTAGLLPSVAYQCATP